MDEKRDDQKDPLDAGLIAAFGDQSVLTHIQRRTGEAPRVTLQDEDAEAEASPVIDPGSAERNAIPQGRGNYQLLGEIARGGMGVVLKGHDTDLGRDVALKVLHRDLAQNDDVLQRFVEEAQIGGQLQHPGIVPVYELGLMADERPYFTMKLVKGRTLAMLLAERKSASVKRRDLLTTFESVCQTMAYAHSRGVIHRDLKPANVMVGAFGEVQVVDWGLAKVLARGGVADERRVAESRSMETVLETVRSAGTKAGSGGSASLVGSVMGTPDYMPPEQAQGQVDRLDERADVFSLGAILCELLTGFPPYHAEGASENTLTNAARGRTDAALERLDACGADRELVELTSECLLAAPAARPAHAGLVAERVHAHLAAVEERAHAAVVEAAVQRRGRRLTAALAATVLVAGLGTGGAWLWFQNQEIERERELAARDREIEAGVGSALQEAARLQGQELFAQALAAVRGAESLVGAGNVDEALRGRIAAVRGDVETAAETARIAAEQLRANKRMIAQLETAEAPETTGADIGTGSIEAAYDAIFTAVGLDVDELDAEDIARQMRARGLGEEMVPFLDRWLVARRRLAGDGSDPEAEGAAIVLIDLLHAFDGDPLRADIREAMLNEDATILRELAAGDLTELSTSTLYLLSVGLGRAGEVDLAYFVLDAGTRLHPDDFFLQRTIVNYHWRAEDRLARLRILQALRPKDRMARMGAGQVLRELSAQARWRGEMARARELDRQAARDYRVGFTGLRDPDLPQYVFLAMAYADTGETEEALHIALEALRILEARPVPGLTDLQEEVRVGLVLRHLGRLEEAIRVFERAAEFDNGRFHLMLTRTLLHVRDGETDQAVALVREYFGKSARDARGTWVSTRTGVTWATPLGALETVGHLATWNREHLHEMLGARDDASRRSVDPGLDALLIEAHGMTEQGMAGKFIDPVMLAIIQLRQEDWEGAVSTLESRVPTFPDADKLVGFILAIAYHHLGRSVEARSELLQAAAITLPDLGKSPIVGILGPDSVAPVLCTEARALLEAD